MAASEQGTAYSTFMATRLKTERDRRSTLETRAVGVVTSSAALISLIFALLTIVVGKDHLFVTDGKWAVIGSLVFFALAALAALIAGLVRRYLVPTDEDFRNALSDRWTDTEVSARLACAWMDFETMTSLRDGNNVKAAWLEAALTLQLAATVALAIGVGLELSEAL